MRAEQPAAQDAGVGQPGRLARRLIEDLFLGRLECDPHDPQESELAPQWSCRNLRGSPGASLEHDLILLPTQYQDDTSDRSTLLSCMCRHCRYHFVFSTSAGRCGLGQENYPQHHFLLEKIETFDIVDVETNQDEKFCPIRCRASYRCSACDQRITLEVSAPRLLPQWVHLIGDPERIRENLRAAREEDPARYETVTEEQEARYIRAPFETLNHYLRDVLESQSDRRISVRNKTFTIQFGEGCERIFRYLGFKIGRDGETGDAFWFPPRLHSHPGVKTPLGSERAFFEDVRSEVQSLLEEQQHNGNGRPVVELVAPPPRGILEKALGVAQIGPRYGARPRPPESEVASFRVLGISTDSDDPGTLRWAYQRQVHTDPLRRKTYLEALANLASTRDPDLQLFTIQQQEDYTVGDGPVDKAYAHFNLRKSGAEPPGYFINVYRTFREQSSLHKAQHRKALLLIGRDRQSEEILDEVYKTPMELDEAASLLGVEPTWPMDSIAALAQSTVEESDLELTVKALEVISLSRNDESRAAFEAIFAEIRSGLAHQSSTSGAADSTQAGKQSDNNDSGTCDMSLPVGLANLRNTCYLNSILQYFYSVNAVRDLVLSLEQPRLEPTEESLQVALERVDPTQREPGRAFVGSQFAHELRSLFEELNKSGFISVTPRQRLANAALLRPDRVRPRTEESAPPVGPANSDPPPLPPRASENAEPTVTVDAVQEHSETASVVSSQTLVDKPDDDPSYVVISHKSADKANSAAMDIDAPAAAASAPPKEAEPQNSKLTVEELAAELDKPNVGSDQMDVDEVMGNAIDHLRAAYKVAHINRQNAGRDPIEQAFFSTFIDSRKKATENKWNQSTRSDRWVTAYPPKSGRRDLYEALAISFDLERMPGDLLSYTSIERPAPNFHICIQRSDGVSKNSNPIVIPDRLYLDRFMHTNDSESDLFKAKALAWNAQNRVNELQPASVDASIQSATTGKSANVVPQMKAEDFPTEAEIDGFLMIGGSDIPGDPFTRKPSGDGDNVAADSWNVMTSTIRKISSLHKDVEIEVPGVPPNEPPPGDVNQNQTAPQKAQLHSFWQAFAEAQQAEQEELLAVRDEAFQRLKSIPYRLHAVVCHAGATASAGHYWVWIHDFEQDVWRKYNDTRVSVHSAEYVFNELNTKGEPYYLAYVREEEISELVSIPRRQQITTTDADMSDAPHNSADTEPPPYDMH